MTMRLLAVSAALLGLVLAVALLRENTDAPAQPARSSAHGTRSPEAEFWQHYREATAHRVAGDHTAATSLYRRALDINPDHEDGLYYLGNLYLDAGREEDALTTWLRLVTVNPGSARGHTRLGDLHVCDPSSRYFDLREGRAAYERATHINRQETGPALRLALVTLMLGETEEAAHQLEAVISENFQSLPGHYYLAYAHWTRRDATAAAAFESALALARPPGDVGGAFTGGGPVVGEGDTQRVPAAPAPGLAASARLGCATFDSFLEAFSDKVSQDSGPTMGATFATVERFFQSHR